MNSENSESDSDSDTSTDYLPIYSLRNRSTSTAPSGVLFRRPNPKLSPKPSTSRGKSKRIYKPPKRLTSPEPGAKRKRESTPRRRSKRKVEPEHIDEERVAQITRNLSRITMAAGSYGGYNISMAAIQHAYWYDVEQLMQVVHQMRQRKWTVAENRNQMLELLNKAICPAPFSRTTRFPADRGFICEAMGDWTRKFQQLRGSLDFKDHFKDGKTKDAPASVFQDANDAHQTFNNVTTEIIDEIVRLQDVYDLAMFEARFHLTWQVGPAQN